jgi:HlyD family secretion protein
MRWPISRRAVIIVVGLVLVVGLGLKVLFRPAKGSRQYFSTALVRQGDIGRMLKVSGMIKPFKAWKVASLVSAKIKTINVKEGDVVTKNQLLVQLDEDELKAKLATARASYLKALARMKEVKNWHSSPSYIGAKATLEINKGELAARENEYTQNLQLYKAKAISKLDLTRSKMSMERARNDLAKSKATMADVNDKGGSQAVKEAQAELTAAKLALRDAQENLDNKDIRAPEPGILSIAKSSGEASKGGPAAETTLTEKSSVTPGQVLFIIYSTEQLAVDVYVNEYDVLKLHPDQPCMIAVPALPGTLFPGRVASITTKNTEKLTAFKLRCQILPISPRAQKAALKTGGGMATAKNSPRGEGETQADEYQKIKVGMTANVIIPLEKRSNVLLVPVSALAKQDGRTGVFLMKNGKPFFTQTKVGIISEDQAEIIGGLHKGQRVLRKVPGYLLKQTSDSGEQ